MCRFLSAVAVLTFLCGLTPVAQAQDLRKLAEDVARQGRVVNELRAVLKKNDGKKQRAQHNAAVGQYNATLRAYNEAVAQANKRVGELNLQVSMFNRLVARYNEILSQTDAPKKKKRKRD